MTRGSESEFPGTFNTTQRVLRASLFFNRANMHLACCLCLQFVIISPSLFSSQLLGEIRLNKIALAAWIRLNPIPNGTFSSVKTLDD